MRTVMQALCDRVEQQPNGKLSLLGLIDQLTATEFPVRHENLGVALRVEYGADEVGDTVIVGLDVVNESGGGARVPEVLRRDLPPPIAAGMAATWLCAFNLPDVWFEDAGDFLIVVRMNGQIAAEIPLTVAVA